MRTPVQIVPAVHTEGGEFRLDIIDDAATADNKHWRIVLRNGVLQIVLFDQRQDYGGLQVERRGTQFDIHRGATRDVQL